jgi:hypothetical protein
MNDCNLTNEVPQDFSTQQKGQKFLSNHEIFSIFFFFFSHVYVRGIGIPGNTSPIFFSNPSHPMYPTATNLSRVLLKINNKGENLLYPLKFLGFF